MTEYRSMGARPDDARGTTALEVRKGLAGLFTGPGVLPGADFPLVTGAASWAYIVRKAHWVTSRGDSDGMHLWGNDGDRGAATDPAPGSGLSRIDIIYALHPSADENADTDSVPVIAVAKGSPSSTPVAPTLPPGALELGRNLMTSAATSAVSAGNTITQSAPRAYLVGSPRLIGVDDRTAQILVSGTAWTTVATVTGAATGGRVVVDWDAVAFNGASGADRSITYRVTASGFEIQAPIGGQMVPLAGQPRVFAGYKPSHTPPAASGYVWELQALASAASSVYVARAALEVTEWPL